MERYDLSVTDNHNSNRQYDLHRKELCYRTSLSCMALQIFIYERWCEIMERLTEHEAINELLDYVGDVFKTTISVEAITLARKALKKQIPKKPYRISEIDDNDNAMVECPICHANSDYSINTIKSGYCWKCGQKLDWE